MRSSNDYGTFNEHWGKLLKERSNIDPHGGAYEGLKPATRPVGKRSVVKEFSIRMEHSGNVHAMVSQYFGNLRRRFQRHFKLHT